MSPQRPFFLSGFFAAFRQQPGSSPPSSAAAAANNNNNKPSSSTTTTTTYSVSTPANSSPSRGIAAAAAAAAQSQARLQSPRGIPIPHSPRRRGSDSSSEGFREVLGADRMYIGGRTAAGDEKFFKLGVVRRVRSGDRLSLDRMSL